MHASSQDLPPGGTAPREGVESPVKARPRRVNAAAALASSEHRLRLALEATGACAWDIDPATGLSTWDPASKGLVGFTGTLDHRQALAQIVHPLDLPILLDAISGALDPRGDGRCQVEHRIVGPAENPGEPRWFETLGRARFAPRRGRSPARAELLICVSREITERRAAEHRQALLIAELNHRVKNALANVLALVDQTRRSTDVQQPGAPERRRFHSDLQGRLLALAQTHDLLNHEAWHGIDLGKLVRLAIGPFATPGGAARIAASGPPLSLAPQAAVSLAMALHELGTDAVHHGALSVPAGWVSLDWSIEPAGHDDAPPAEPPAPGALPGALAAGALASGGPASGGPPDANIAAMLWREHDGPPIAGPPARRGFGSRLLERGVALQFGGTIKLEFPAEGLVCRMRLPLRPETITNPG